MLPSEVPPAKPTDVVVSGFSDNELDEMMRGLVQRMTVAQSNIRDKRNTDDMPDWRDIYETCWSAYRKISDAIEHANHTLVTEPPCDDEFAHLSRPVGED